MKVAAPALIRDPTKRANTWRAAHALGARRAERIIRDFGGFYRKVGQIMGTASQMMPEAYVEAFAATMDDNPPVPFSRIRNIVERDFAFSRVASAGDEGVGGSSTRSFDATFASFDPTPLATASIAQVHRATLRSNGAKVVVKVLIADEATMVADVRSMLRTTQFLKAARLDNGVDFPTVFRAYLDVIRGEFDFRAEAERMDEFRALFERRGLSDRVSVPEWFPEASGAKTLASRRATGTKLLTTLRRARAAGRRPRWRRGTRSPGRRGGAGCSTPCFSRGGRCFFATGTTTAIRTRGTSSSSATGACASWTLARPKSPSRGTSSTCAAWSCTWSTRTTSASRRR
jgi:predicted unusual protein kinase regulating ubiquinone biosynthesis (AarF/ABC1/UbiB family)